MNKDFFSRNRQKLIDYMSDGSILLLFSGSPVRRSADSYYPFSVSRNFYYMTGINLQEVVLLISKNSSGVKEVIYLPERTTEGYDYNASAKNAAALSGIEEIRPISHFERQLNGLLCGSRRDGSSGNRFEVLYLDLERTSFSEPISHTQIFARQMAEKYPWLHIRDIYQYIANLRRIKASEEVDEIVKAIGLTRIGIEAMMSACNAGEKESTLEAEFRYIAIKAGERELGFPPIIASGKNAMIGHYDTNNQPLLDGDLVLVDVGCASNLYSADISRVFPVSGKFTSEQRLWYQTVLNTHKEILDYIRPGQILLENRKHCTELLRNNLSAAGITEDNYPGLWCFGGVDHYLGLDTHDVGLYDIPFTPGMVLTVDTAIKLPHRQVAFRIEDDILITENGCRNLSNNILREIDEIEELMNK